MLSAEYCEHHMGAGDPGSSELSMFRVWTPEDSAYGAFQVVSKADLRIIIKAFRLMHGQCVPANDAYIDPIDWETRIDLNKCSKCRKPFWDLEAHQADRKIKFCVCGE